MKVKIEVEVVKYDELPEETKKKLINQERESLAEIWQCDHVLDEHKEKLEAIGFLNPEIHYSGFGSQGDGACFNAKVDIVKVCKHLGIEYDVLQDWSCVIVVVSNHYCHKNTRKISCEGCPNDLIVDKIEELRLSLCDSLYKDLEEDYYSSISDEECLEFLQQRRFAMHRELEDGMETALLGASDFCEGVQII